jgi:cysteine desulfurase
LTSARATIAGILNCAPHELIFTSGASESDNLALRGTVAALIDGGLRPHLITATTEHHAVSHTARALAKSDRCDLTLLAVESDGRIAPDTLCAALRPADRAVDRNRALVSLMLGNNEVGTLHPIAELAAIAHEGGALFHTDAVQAAGQVPLDVRALGIDMLALSAHKFYGPKGVGLLYLRDGIDLIPTQSGGAQEGDRRAGTENVALIVGMAKALELATADLSQKAANAARLRDRVIEGVLACVSGAQLTGHPTERLPNHASFVLEGIDANALLMHLDLRGIAASSGSACNTGNPEPSEVLLAMGYSSALALGSLRITVGAHTTDADIDALLDVLPVSVERLRALPMGRD